jgi:membrane protease YdiL (CAAX protease family)
MHFHENRQAMTEPIEALQPTAAPVPEEERRLIAPWWHTGLLLLLILATSVLGTLHSAKGPAGSHHFANYTITIGWEWALAGIAWWGLRLKKTSLREVLGERRRGVREFLNDALIAGVFWIISMIVLAVLAVFLKVLHLESAQKQIAALAPSSIAEAALWIALSVSAGICEEFVFRGYLQQQFARSTGRLWLGVLVSSLLFGAAHGYEGIAGMLLIALYGGLFSVLAIRRKSLRAGMIAHGWHDSISGVALWLLKRAHVPLGIA